MEHEEEAEGRIAGGEREKSVCRGTGRDGVDK